MFSLDCTRAIGPPDTCHSTRRAVTINKATFLSTWRLIWWLLRKLKWPLDCGVGGAAACLSVTEALPLSLSAPWIYPTVPSSRQSNESESGGDINMVHDEFLSDHSLWLKTTAESEVNHGSVY